MCALTSDFSPLFLQLIMNGLARLLCMHEPPPNDPVVKTDTRSPVTGVVTDNATSTTSPHRRHKDRKKIKCPELKYNKFQPPVYDFHDGATTSTRNHTTPDRSPLHNQVIEGDVKEIKRILRTYMNRLENKDAQGKINKEWRIVARVLDRMFFFLYLATIIVSLATIFPRA